MVKKVYALKKGWKPGIYMNQLDLYDQIQDFKDYDMRSFTYQEELKDESEEVEESLSKDSIYGRKIQYNAQQSIKHIKMAFVSAEYLLGVLQNLLLMAQEKFFVAKKQT